MPIGDNAEKQKTNAFCHQSPHAEKKSSFSPQYPFFVKKSFVLLTYNNMIISYYLACSNWRVFVV